MRERASIGWNLVRAWTVLVYIFMFLPVAVVVLLITWAGGGLFNLLAVAIGFLVFHEWLEMSRARDARDQPSVGRWSTPVLGGIAVMIAVAILVFLELFGLALALAFRKGRKARCVEAAAV